MPERRPAIQVPFGGFLTNEDEAKWLERTIIMRTEEALQMIGVNATMKDVGLYDLFLLSLNSATKRALKAQPQ